MIYDASTLPDGLRLRADLCIVGSGAGGAMVAWVAAQAGLRTVILEAGPFLSPEDMTQREDEMLPQLYWDAAGRTTVDRRVRLHQGKGVGGSTLHNLNLCKRVPDQLLVRWQQTRGMTHLPPDRWHTLFDEVERMLEVTEVPRDRWNRHNLLLEAGVQKLGWRGGGLKHNRTGCTGSGYCEVGCAYDAKNNAAKVLIPQAIAKGAEVLAHCQAVRVVHDGRRVAGVQAIALHPRTNEPLHRLHVEAPRVCLAGSATGTPALLQRSEVPDPGGETGRRLRVHPAVVVAGDFPDPVQAWQGIPQTYECTEWLDFQEHPHPPDPTVPRRVWIVPAFGHPMGTATMMPGIGRAHRDIMRRYAHLAVLTAMLHDESAGTVRPDGDLGLKVDYRPDASDWRELKQGLVACARLLWAAGATKVYVPTREPLVLTTPAEAERLVELPDDALDLTAVHPMGAVPMGDDPRVAAVSSQGRHHHLQGLWIGDGSLLPTSIGGPPQLSIYALGLHVGRALVAAG